MNKNWIDSGRKLLGIVCIAAIGLMISPDLQAKNVKTSVVRFGILTDIHYADREPAKERYYWQSLTKMKEAIDTMNQEKVDFIVELGDFKDQDLVPTEKKTLKYLADIESVFRKFHGPTYHVLGNHDMDGISKSQFQSEILNTGISPEKTYYSFNQKGIHFVILDGNYTKDGRDFDHGTYRWENPWIPAKEMNWLKEDLKSDELPSIIFIHQLLDDSKGMKRSVQNAAAVRKILEKSGKVLCVFQGHINAEKYDLINRIHYYSLISMVEGDGPENSSYVIVDVHKKGGLKIHGYRRATDQKFGVKE